MQLHITTLSKSMKKLLLAAITGLLLNTSASWAKDNMNAVAAYKCTNKSGKVGIGTGRPSLENEYSSFLKKFAREGEYVIFRYENEATEYWFKSPNCSKM